MRSRRFTTSVVVVVALFVALFTGSAAQGADSVIPQNNPYVSKAAFDQFLDIYGCHGHVDPPEANTSATYPDNLYAYGYVTCTEPQDVSVLVKLAWYNSSTRKWVEVSPGDSSHHVASLVSGYFWRNCRGHTYYHWATTMRASINSVQAPGLRSTDIGSYCSHG